MPPSTSSTTPIQPILDAHSALQSTLHQPSRSASEPFIKLPGSGTAPVLNYNIPQETCFTSNSAIAKLIPVEFFKDFTKNVPVNNYYENIERMNTTQLNQMFYPNGFPVAASGGIYNTMMNPGSIKNNVGAANAGALPNTNQFIARNSGLSSLPAGAVFSPTDGSEVVTTSLPPTPMGVPIRTSDYPEPVAAGFVSPNTSVYADMAQQGLRPIAATVMGNRISKVQYVAKPVTPTPRIAVIEEYRTCSYLGDYGAGKVIKTMSLLPGERTTISIRTYSDRSTTSSYSDNVLDSFSNSSADELDRLVQHESGIASSDSSTDGSHSASYATSTDTRNASSNFNLSVGGSLNLGILNLHANGSYGRSETEAASSSSTSSSTSDRSHTGMRSANVSNLDNAMAKHVAMSNANRQMEVNHTTNTTASSGEEDVTVRELINVNKSRVLNFVWRQMLQEYSTVTSLVNLKFAYSNGYPETLTIVPLENLVNMVTDLIKEEHIDEVLCILLKNYCEVLNYDDVYKQFIEKRNMQTLIAASVFRSNQDAMYMRSTIALIAILLTITRHRQLQVLSSSMCAGE